MQYIREFQINDAVEIDLLVKASEIKRTRVGKPFLSLTLTDGTDDISANIWDWFREDKPNKNDLLHLVGSMGEFNGTKQLQVTCFKQNLEMSIEDFMPRGEHSIELYLEYAFDLIREIQHEVLRDLTETLFMQTGSLWRRQPGAKSVHHAYVAGNLQHCVDVAHKAKAMAQLIPEASLDLTVAGALLHDIGKLWTYDFEGMVIDFTESGHLLDHISIGIIALERMRSLENQELIALLQHIIASHHGKLEYGSPVTPRCIEAWIINYCDGIDVKAQVISNLNRKASPTATMTEKDWTLENRPMITQNRVTQILNNSRR